MTTEITGVLKVLLVDDDNAVRGYIAASLRHSGYRVVEACNATEGLALYVQHGPDLVLLDVVMPGHDGHWLAHQLREREAGQWTPIIFLSGRSNDEDLARGIEAGGDDYLIKPVSQVVLAAKMRALSRLRATQNRLREVTAQLSASNENLQYLSAHDTLTGLLNRRGFNDRLATAVAVARRNQTPLTLMLCDIDQFKLYNDRLGHPAGDSCLSLVGSLLRQVCRRPGDVAARYGGEEFALILPDTPKSGALTFARMVRRMFEAKALAHPASTVAPHVTVSGGITTCVPTELSTPDGMITRADEALYVAKAKGRDRFFSFEMQLDSSAPLPSMRVAA